MRPQDRCSYRIISSWLATTPKNDYHNEQMSNFIILFASIGPPSLFKIELSGSSTPQACGAFHVLGHAFQHRSKQMQAYTKFIAMHCGNQSTLPCSSSLRLLFWWRGSHRRFLRTDVNIHHAKNISAMPAESKSNQSIASLALEPPSSDIRRDLTP